MKGLHELVYSIQGIEDLAAILDIDFKHAFIIAQRIRDELKSSEHESSDAQGEESTDDTILEYDLSEIQQMIRKDPEYP